MHLNPQIHDTQDTLKIHVGYIGIHSGIRISSPTCGRAWMRAGATPFPLTPEIRIPHVSLMYPSCIPHVFRMYLDSILISTPEDTCIPHVSRMYLACIPHVSFISDTYLSG